MRNFTYSGKEGYTQLIMIQEIFNSQEFQKACYNYTFKVIPKNGALPEFADKRIMDLARSIYHFVPIRDEVTSLKSLKAKNDDDFIESKQSINDFIKPKLASIRESVLKTKQRNWTLFCGFCTAITWTILENCVFRGGDISSGYLLSTTIISLSCFACLFYGAGEKIIGLKDLDKRANYINITIGRNFESRAIELSRGGVKDEVTLDGYLKLFTSTRLGLPFTIRETIERGLHAKQQQSEQQREL